ncbi:MAG: hypothetical protein NVS3B10_19770 [Polyangiales bacterium]
MKSGTELWSNAQDVPPPDVSLHEIVARAEKLRRKLRRANAREYVAGALVIIAFVAMAALPVVRLPPLSRVGAALIACASIFVLTYLALRGAAGEVRRDASTLACYRDELERRRALLSSVVAWYVAPFWPGTLLFFAGMVVEHPDDPGMRRAVGFSIAFAVAVNAGIVWMNRRAARKLAAELASLPAPDF